MASTSKIVGTCVDDISMGTRIWATPGNATADDNSTADTPNVKTTTMHYLKGTMLGNVFAIPGGSTINGITVTAGISANFAGTWADAAVRLVIGGTVGTGDDKKRGPTEYWPTSEYAQTWGGSADDWNETLTPAVVNATGFGAAISCVEVNANRSIASVDYIQLTVHYTEGGAAEVANVTDDAGAATSQQRATDATRPTTDDADAATSATRLLAATRPTTDGADAATTATATKSAPADVSDGASAATSASTQKTASASNTDGVDASTLASTTKTTTTSNTDGADASTAQTAVKQAPAGVANVTDSADAATSATMVKAGNAIVSDGVDGSTVATATKTASASNTDGIGASTDTSAVASKAAIVVDGAEASDTATTIKAASVEVVDSGEASTSATATSISGYTADVSDSVGAESVSTRNASFGRVQVDSAGGSEVPTRQTDAGRLQEDDAETTDVPVALLDTPQAEVSDSVGAGDTTARGYAGTRAHYEMLSATDSMNTFAYPSDYTAEPEPKRDYWGDPMPGVVASDSIEIATTAPRDLSLSVTDGVDAQDGASCITPGGGGPDPMPGADTVTPLQSNRNQAAYVVSSTQYAFSGSEALPTIIPGALMAAGVDYLVMASCSTQSNMDNQWIDVKLVVDRETSSNVARLRQRGTRLKGVLGNPEPIGHLAGYTIVTGTGNSNSDVEFAYSSTNIAEWGYIYSPNIVAIPLNELTENSDYWVFEHNSDAGQGVFTQDPWIDIASIDVTGIDAGDYLVLASTEFKCAATANEAQVRLQIDSVTEKDIFHEKCESNAIHNQCMAYARLHTLTAGNHTITLQGGSYSGNYTKYFQRRKLIIVKASMWNQMLSASDDSEYHTQTHAYETQETQDITLGTSGYIVGITNARIWRDGTGASAAQLGIASGGPQSDGLYVKSGGLGITNQNSVTGFFCDSVSGTQTLRFGAGFTNDDTDTYTDYRDLIVWEMRMAGVGQPAVADVTDGVGATDNITAVKTGNFPRTVTDGAGASDTIELQFGWARPVTDGVGADDTVTRATVAARTITDGVGAADTHTTSSITTPDVFDNVGASDSIIRTTVAARSTTDGAGASDSITGVKGVAGYTADITDSAGASDSITIALTLNRAVQDILAVSDAVTKDIDKRIADAVGAGDTVTATLTTVTEVVDGAGASDAITIDYAYQRGVTDGVGAADVLNRVGVYARLKTDDAAAVDTFIAQLGGTGIDALTVTSTISTTADLTSTIYETGGS